MNLDKNLREFIALLNSTGVRYVLVGGHAVAFHGHPRYTGDIDFFVEPSAETASKLERVLIEFGFGGLQIKAADFLAPGIIVQLGRPPNRIDLLTAIDAVTFEQAWNGRVAAELDGLPVAIIGRAELLRNKRGSGRPQDLADLAKIEK